MTRDTERSDGAEQDDEIVEYTDSSVQSKGDVADDIDEWVDDARQLAREMGLDPYHVNYWVVDNDEMNELITYNGFQKRYPHWRWGMQYDRQRKESEYLGGKAFEIVNNDNPAHAFLQQSNTEADQKAVVTHVEAHADFFKNNAWFDDDPSAAERLARHADRVEEILSDPEIDRTDVEWWIDTLLCIEDTIDQHQFTATGVDSDVDVEDHVEGIDVHESVKEQFFDEEWIEKQSSDDDREFRDDVFAVLLDNGEYYDEEEGKAVEMEQWQKDIVSIIRDEAYYFAPQKMTKIMNEGYAAIVESIMMANEQFADDNEFVTYADHMSMVLDAPGFNPYKLGKEIWEHIENTTNVREVCDKLLRIEGVTPGNFHREIDVDRVLSILDQPESYSPAVRNFSLVRPHNRGVLRDVDRETLVDQYRYMVDTDRYESIDDALDDVDYEAGWKRMREVRETHVDPTFIAEFVTDEFIERNDYFTYDYNPSDDQKQVSSTDPDDVRKKLLLKFTNFGKPTIVVEETNYRNSGELLLTHKYNGISLDVEQAKSVIERIHRVWGRPVNIRTVVKYGDDEHGMEFRYDGGGVIEEHELSTAEYEYLLPEDLDYDVRPDEWL